MSLIARCPACGTLFRVVPDQLKISDGWVRCGQCAEVFDANQSLQQLESAVPAPHGPDSAPQPEAQSLPEAQALPEPQAPTEPEPLSASERLPESEPLSDSDRSTPEPSPSPDDLSISDGPLQAGETLPAPAAAPAAAHAAAHAAYEGSEESERRERPEIHDLHDPYGAREPELGEPVLAPEPLDPAPVASLADDQAAAVRPPPQDVSFVRQARRRAFWQSRGMRLTLAVLATALTLSLAGQVAYHQRDRLASQVPALQPVLAALCEAMECRLGPPRRIESIAIESSAFTRLRPDAFRLQLTLNNQADIALAVPALELTLTDLQDQPVLRRVLQPSDLGPDAPAAIASRAEWSSTLTLTVAAGVDPSRIVGYRVLAFYP